MSKIEIAKAERIYVLCTNDTYANKELAIFLFKSGEITAQHAARIAGVSTHEILDECRVLPDGSSTTPEHVRRVHQGNRPKRAVGSVVVAAFKDPNLFRKKRVRHAAPRKAAIQDYDISAKAAARLLDYQKDDQRRSAASKIAAAKRAYEEDQYEIDVATDAQHAERDAEVLPLDESIRHGPTWQVRRFRERKPASRSRRSPQRKASQSQRRPRSHGRPTS